MGLSAYEEERRVRIAANKELLVSLGIEADRDKLARAVTAHRRPEIAARRPAKGAVNQKRGRKEREDPFPEELLRRYIKAEQVEGAPTSHAAVVKSEEVAVPAIVIKEEPGCAGGGAAVARRGEASSRELAAELAMLAPMVGRRLPGGHVKDGVMQFVSPRCRAKFSKYVGVQEWTNAIFLMLNVAAGNGYGNSFIETDGGKGMNVNYFLSDRTKPDAPVVRRLTRSVVRPLGDAAVAPPGQPSVHLFARPSPGSDRPGNALGLDNCDYVYLGRCRRLAHKLDASPIEFLFALQDFPALKGAPDFAALMRLAQAP